MLFEYALGAIATIFIAIYLLYALARPERF